LALLTRRPLLGALALLLTSAAASTASAASTSTIATTSLSAALALGLRSVSVSGFSFRRVGCRIWTAIAYLRLLHKSFFGRGAIARTALRSTLRQLVGLTLKIGSAGLVAVIALVARRVGAAALSPT
jgi:hypothetical protein